MALLFVKRILRNASYVKTLFTPSDHSLMYFLSLKVFIDTILREDPCQGVINPVVGTGKNIL